MARTRQVDAQDGGSAKPRDSEVLDIAIKTFYRYGYAASSVQMIADELGILKGSLYYYMRGKEDLLYRVLRDVHRQLSVILEEAQTDTDTPPLERLGRYVEQQVSFAARHIPQIAVYYRDVDQLSEERRREVFALRREHQVFVRELIAQAQADGDVPGEEDPDVLADLVFGSFIWTYRWYDAEGTLSVEDLAAACGRFAVRALTDGPRDRVIATSVGAQENLG